MATPWEDDPVAEEQFTGSVMSPSVPYYGEVEALRSAAQGATFGFADEIEAAVRSGAISGQQYEAIRNRLREQQKQFGADYPVVSGTAEVVGALAAPMGAYKALRKAAPAVQEAITGTTLPGQVAIGAAAGGVTGALTGAGTAETDIGEAATRTGVFSAAVGGVVPVAIRGAGTIIRNALNAFGVGINKAQLLR